MPSGPKLRIAEALSDVLKATPPKPTPKPVPPHSPLDRRTLIPSSFTLAISNLKAAQLFYELKILNIDKFPVAGALCLRSFVEAVVDIYCVGNKIELRHKTGQSVGKALSLGEKVESVLQHCSSSLTKQENTAARTALTNQNSVVSVGRLNEYVHNPAMFPAKNDLIAAWSGVEAFFRVVCK